MNPDKKSYEETIRDKPFRPMAMSILASGAIDPVEAVDYVMSQGKIRSIIFGASSDTHIQQIIDLVHQHRPVETSNIAALVRHGAGQPILRA
jgi:NAD-dependent SIR2 family protein deacetylase